VTARGGIGANGAGPAAISGTVRCSAVSDDDGLDRLSAKELHDLAIQRAKRHFDVGFYWRLLQVLPMAETVAGKYEDVENDLDTTLGHIDDVTDAGEGEVAEQLRPFYLDYLRDHGVKAP
jgi:hypothetical protein